MAFIFNYKYLKFKNYLFLKNETAIININNITFY